jgi:hypothetical protein
MTAPCFKKNKPDVTITHRTGQNTREITSMKLMVNQTEAAPL